MLSDEENKAIKIAKGITEDDLLNYWEGPEEPYNAIQTILNLIEKQQKEIEELKDKNKTLKNLQNDTNGLYIGMIERKNYFERELQKLEDKIKAKIEEYDDKGMTVNLVNRSAGKTFQQALRTKVKKILESLLEKE